jgi:hypothetical protein
VGDHPTVVDNGVSVSGNLRSVPVVYKPLLTGFIVVGATVVRAAMDDWDLLSILTHFWRALSRKLELHVIRLVNDTAGRMA